MTGAFLPNGPQDLQRHPQWGIPRNSFVPAFTGSASYHLGSVTRWAGLPVDWAEIGGGIPNWVNAGWQQVKKPPVPRLGIYPKKIDANGPHGLSWHNYDNIVKGFADADVARNGASPINDFGYGPQAQYPAGQIGDGNGLGVGDWRFPLAGVDPMNPMQPVPPTQTGNKPSPRLVRVSGNPSPASVFDTKAHGVPYLRPNESSSPESQKSSGGGLAEWIAALAGVDPRNPMQAAPPPLDDGLRALYRDDPAWFLQVRR